MQRACQQQYIFIAAFTAECSRIGSIFFRCPGLRFNNNLLLWQSQLQQNTLGDQRLACAIAEHLPTADEHRQRMLLRQARCRQQARCSGGHQASALSTVRCGTDAAAAKNNYHLRSVRLLLAVTVLQRLPQQLGSQ